MVNYRVEALAKKAFSAAYKEALATEEGVTAVIDGVLYQVFKDGTKKKIKDIPPKIKLDLNKEYTLRAQHPASSKVPRLRMFAGPNGSGKSCFNNIVNAKWLGVYVNADEIEKKLVSGGVLLSDFRMQLDDAGFMDAFKTSCSSRKIDLPAIRCVNGKVTVKLTNINSYYAAMIAELIRLDLLSHSISFTFETVMSHESKLDFLKLAKDKGYRTYLYFIATEDPQINVSRVASRVRKGGHDVPKHKIVARYHRAIKLLPKALKIVDRGFVFDNSSDSEVWLIETNNVNEEASTRLELKSIDQPHWMKAVIKAE